MLQTQTVSLQLLELLKAIMREESFAGFALAGGTSLALQTGHRNSIDIDLFGKSEINKDLFSDILNSFGNVVILQSSKNILILKVDAVKIDFVNNQHPLLEDILIIDGVRLFSKKDIAAMKLNAILGRGSKKDFIDLYFLLQEFSLKEMIAFYNQKYADGSEFLVLKSLTYFDDADLQPEPVMYADFDWELCKEKITSEFNKFILK